MCDNWGTTRLVDGFSEELKGFSIETEELLGGLKSFLID